MGHQLQVTQLPTAPLGPWRRASPEPGSPHPHPVGQGPALMAAALAEGPLVPLPQLQSGGPRDKGGRNVSRVPCRHNLGAWAGHIRADGRAWETSTSIWDVRMARVCRTLALRLTAFILETPIPEEVPAESE